MGINMFILMSAFQRRFLFFKLQHGWVVAVYQTNENAYFFVALVYAKYFGPVSDGKFFLSGI